ncbi:TnsD family Tn7-like transposition protein [Sphingomonas sp. AR_OL41]|uniref:TnsD family Tn7-like transposition protein n=1 Tax=Sphingomonas sp. AR_OL41 TaxID=3042729 RepID=UPI0024805B0D|nr:TnsD family Tn7-like transposition protein [Sphingomonas sp. AR_OL41]MDH7973050.1 TnsD family Tn7-like transposition protein [Sphingomonas sp. AR_OL41]
MSGENHERQAVKFAPRLYDDELLHSFLARYGFARGHATARHVNRDLMAKSSSRAPFDLPTSLDRMSSALAGLGLSGEYLAWHHTLLPYYIAFAPSSRRAMAMQALLGEEGSPSLIAGKRSGWLVRPTAIRYCVDCNDIAASDREELRWARQHQLPLVTMCPVHGRPLKLGPPLGVIREKYIRATVENTPPSGPNCVDPIDSDERDALMWLSMAAGSVLDSFSRDDRDATSPRPTQLETDFGRRLIEQGYSRGKSVDMVASGREVRAVLQPLTRIFPTISEGGSSAPVWFDHLIDGRSSSQTDSVIVGNFVLSKLRGRRPIEDAVGPSPWLCHNPLAPHSGKRVVTEAQGPWRAEGGKWRMRFKCCCGHIYTLALRSDGTATRPTTIRMGPMLYQFVDMARVQGWKLKKAARHLGIDPGTLYNLCLREGIDPPWPKPVGSGKSLSVTGISKEV